MNVLKPIGDGIKESFVLAASIVVAVVTVISSFATHSSSLKVKHSCARDSTSIETPPRNV